MEQLYRVMRLHHLLLTSRQSPSRDYLLERLECSLSTFKRLLQTLREQHQSVARQPVRPEIFDTVLSALLRESRLQCGYCGVVGVPALLIYLLEKATC